MRKNKIIKIIYILLITISLLFMFKNVIYAREISIPASLNSIYTQNDTTIATIGGRVMWIMQTIFYAVAVIILIFAGVSYMYAAPEGKAEIKKKMIYLAIGAFLLFAAGGITQIIANLAFRNIR